MSDQPNIDAGLDNLERGPKRIAAEKRELLHALVRLYERLGEKDPDVLAVDAVASGWHELLIRLTDNGTAWGLMLRDLVGESAGGSSSTD